MIQLPGIGSLFYPNTYLSVVSHIYNRNHIIYEVIQKRSMWVHGLNLSECFWMIFRKMLKIFRWNFNINPRFTKSGADVLIPFLDIKSGDFFGINSKFLCFPLKKFCATCVPCFVVVLVESVHCNKSTFAIYLSPSVQPVCTWSLLFCRINKGDFFFFFLRCFSRISAASTVSVRIQITIGPEYKRSVSYLEYKSVWSVNGSEGALQWRMAIEMRQKNASEIKKRMSRAVQSTPALQLQLIPAPSASRHGIIFHNDTRVQISPSLFFLSFKSLHGK